MTAAQKNDVVIRFLQGDSVSDISAFYAMTRSSAEELLRHAMFSLMKVRETSVEQLGYERDRLDAADKAMQELETQVRPQSPLLSRGTPLLWRR